MATVEPRRDADGNIISYRAKSRVRGFPSTSKTFAVLSDDRGGRRARKAAKAWGEKEDARKHGGEFVDLSAAKTKTLSELLDTYIKRYVPTLAPSTRRNQENFAKALKRRRIAQYAMANISPETIFDFIAEREEEGVKRSTVSQDLNVISTCFDMSESWGVPGLTDNPVKAINKNQRVKKRRIGSPADNRRNRRLSAEEEKFLLDGAQPTMKLVIRFALATAMRQSEIANLKQSDVDRERREATLHDTKDPRRPKTRTVPLSKPALKVLDEIPEHERDTIFPVNVAGIRTGFTRARNKAKRLYHEACEAQGMEPDTQFLVDFTFHDLRHEATSRLFEHTTLDSMRIAEITGHDDIRMLKRYYNARRKTSIIAALDNAFK